MTLKRWELDIWTFHNLLNNSDSFLSKSSKSITIWCVQKSKCLIVQCPQKFSSKVRMKNPDVQLSTFYQQSTSFYFVRFHGFDTIQFATKYFLWLKSIQTMKSKQKDFVVAKMVCFPSLWISWIDCAVTNNDLLILFCFPFFWRISLVLSHVRSLILLFMLYQNIFAETNKTQFHFLCIN